MNGFQEQQEQKPQDQQPSCREVLLLSVLGFSPTEISEETGFPEKHVATMLASPLAQNEMARMELRLQKRISAENLASEVERILQTGKLTAARTLLSLVGRHDNPAVQRQASLDILELPPEGLSKKRQVEVEHQHSMIMPEGPALILAEALREVAERQQPRLVGVRVLDAKEQTA